MNVTSYKHNWDKFNPTPRAIELLDGVMAAVANLPLFIWPNKTDKSENVKDLCVLQSMLNVWIEAEFRELGWTPEVPVKPGRDVRVDFAAQVTPKTQCMVEVEFGNQARIDCDMRKLLEAFHWDILHFGIVILPTNRLAKITTGGGATFEAALNDVRSCHPKTVPFPVCLIGLDQRNTHAVDLSQTRIGHPDILSGNSAKMVLHHVVSEYRAGVCVEDIGLPGVTEIAKLSGTRRAKSKALVGQMGLF